MEDISKFLKRDYNSLVTDKVLNDEIERAYQLLQKAYEDIDKLRKEKTEFISFITHLLRTPLTNLSAFHLLEKYNISEEQQEILNIAKHGYREMEYIINRAIEYFSIVTDLPTPNFEKIDILTLIGDSIFEKLEKFREMKVNYFVNIEKNITIETDIDIVFKILNILIDNAVKFNRKHGKVFFSYNEIDDKILINIQDTGLGIKKDALEKIFFPFSVQNIKFHSHGAGLNLAIAKNLSHFINSELTADSEGLGLGSTFTLILPQNPNFVIEKK